MTRDTRWEALLDPGHATDFFAGGDGVPPLAAVGGWSLANAWWCSEMSRAVYRRDDRAAMFARVGLVEQQFFDDGSTQAVLLRGEAVAVLVFRGTSDLRDWVSNVRVKPVDWPAGGRVHRGFARALDRVWAAIDAALAPIDTPVLVAGHSLGGALASLAASRRTFCDAYTFGAPFVGDTAFWQTLRSPLHRVVHGRDIVPSLPPKLGYQQGGELHHLDAAGVVTTHDVLEAVDVLRGRRWYDPHPTLSDHAPVNYSAALRAAMSG